mgnify:CR=1 FL=1
MWNSYFFQIQSKYSMRVSFKNPLVIRLDGKGYIEGIVDIADEEMLQKIKNMIC